MTRPWLPGDSPLRLLTAAVLVGMVAGLGAVVFRGLIGLIHNLMFFGRISPFYDTNLHTEASPAGIWVIGVPVAGAVVVAFLVKKFAPEAKGHGVPEVMQAIYYQGGVIRPVVALVKALASSISIGTGGAVGREGPIIQIGAAFGSTLGGLIRLPEWQRVTLIASGAAGGIAATFNTPIGGLLFAGELLLPEISARTLIPVAVATVTGTVIGQTFFGTHPAFDIPALAVPMSHLTQPLALVAYAVLGLVLGAVSAVYVKAIYAFEDGFDRLPGNYYTRHMLGMFLVGTMMYLFMRYSGHYYVQGVGYATVQDVLTGVLVDPYFLLLLLVAKLAATSLTLGSGASGGIFSPSLFMGATLGGAFALLAGQLFPQLGIEAPGGAVVGMAGMVGGATGAVVTAIVMVFEMTRDYKAIVPLLITVSFAYGLRRLITDDSIYSLKITRRGHYIPESLHTHGYLLRTASDMLSAPTKRIVPGSEVQLPQKPSGKLWGGPPDANLLFADAATIYAVLPAEDMHGKRLFGSTTAELQSACSDRYVTVAAADTVCELMGSLRRARCRIALVTSDGTLKSPDDVLGVLTWNDLVRHANLPGSLLERRDASAEG